MVLKKQYEFTERDLLELATVGPDLVTVDSLQPGRLWNFQRINVERVLYSWYRGDLRSLFAEEPNDYNGLALIDSWRDIMRLNLFRRLTEFLVDTLYAEPPEGLPPEDIETAESATRWSSIKGMGVFAAEPGSIWSVDPSHYFALYDETGQIYEGDLLAYPFHSNPLSTDPVPDRLAMIIRTAEINERRTVALKNLTLGETLDVEPSALAGVVTFGTGSDYPDVAPVLRELMLRFTFNSYILNRHSSPHLQGPQDTLEPGKNDFDPRGMFLPLVDKDSVPYSYLTWDTQGSLSQYHVNTLLDMFHLLTGYPSTALGLTTSEESGVSRERQLYSALKKVGRTQRDVERKLNEARALAGLPTIDIEWPVDPFSSFEQRADIAVKLVQSGIWDAERAGRFV